MFWLPNLTFLSLIFVVFVVIHGVNSSSITRVVTKDIQKQSSTFNASHLEKPRPSGCMCKSYSCGCCAHLDIPKVGLNDTGCIDLTYLQKEYGIALTFSLDGKVVFNKTISAKNPPPVCFGVPHLTAVSLCLRFYKLSADLKHFSGCIRVEAHLYHVLEEEVELGCFHFGHPTEEYKRVLLKEIMTNRILDRTLP